MDEVELTSEFMLLIMSGILERKASTISDYYDAFDKVFAERKEVASRFRTTFDTIEALLPKDVIARLFNRRALFYVLFVTVYGLQFGLRSPAKLDDRQPLTREKPKPIKAGMAEQFKDAALSIKRKDAPQLVLESLRGGVNHTPQRRAVIAYLAGDGNSPLPPLP